MATREQGPRLVQYVRRAQPTASCVQYRLGLDLEHRSRAVTVPKLVRLVQEGGSRETSRYPLVYYQLSMPTDEAQSWLWRSAAALGRATLSPAFSPQDSQRINAIMQQAKSCLKTAMYESCCIFKVW